MNELPPGWVHATADQITACDRYALAIGPFGSNLKVSDYRSSGVPLVFVRNIRARAFGSADLRFVSHEKAESLLAHQVRHGDLLITKMGDPPGDTAIYPLTQPGIITADCIKLTPHPLIDVSYLLYAIRAPYVQRQIGEITQGVAQRKVSLDRFRKRVAIPLAPRAEQNRIVAAAEEQFSRLDAGLAVLDRVQQKLKRMRQAALDHIIGFEFGAQLPAEWEWKTVKDVAGDSSTPVLTGPFGTALSRSDFGSEGIPVLTIGCLTSDGIQIGRAPRVSSAKARALRRYALQPGDVLFSRMATVGRAAVVSEAEEGSLINYHLMRLRLDQKIILPDFLVLLCRGSRAIQQYLSETNHGVTRPGINTRQLLGLPVALPPINEQERIVRIVRFWDEVTFQLDKEVALAVIRARQLRSSILTAAFSGRLVPQDPTDESASVLLQRITAEQTVSNGHRPKRGRKPRILQEEVTA